MHWEREAEALLGKVPFFVRRRVRRKVEDLVRGEGRDRVTVRDVLAARERFLREAAQVEEGFVVEGCFGASGCPNAVTDSSSLIPRLEQVLREEDLTGLLRRSVGGPLKHHHQFRVALSECPNACSQVQIRDFALIGQAVLRLDRDLCSLCGECEAVCEEGALAMEGGGVRLDGARCLRCGACARVCPTGALRVERRGWRVLVGGKLGRHPQFARELLPLAAEEEVPELLRRVVAFYRRHQRAGERLGAVIQRLGWEESRREMLADR